MLLSSLDSSSPELPKIESNQLLVEEDKRSERSGSSASLLSFDHDTEEHKASTLNESKQTQASRMYTDQDN